MLYDFNFRQGNEGIYTELLSRIRVGEFDPDRDFETLRGHILSKTDPVPTFEDGILPTIVFTTRSSTDNYNNEQVSFSDIFSRMFVCLFVCGILILFRIV